jgi:tagatose 1,6-diphosphate aldolase GatY/KbaY
MINVAQELKKAREGGYAIPAFNTANLEVTKGICAGVKGRDNFILIQTTPSAIDYAGLEQIYNIVMTEIEATGIKAAIHLDHAKDFAVIKKAIQIGYKSVMFDGSKLSFEENAHLTERLVEYAHRFGVSVEAEVGVIGREEGGMVSGKSVMSAPHEVKRFVDMTGVDSIAVSVGNEHGAPKGEKVDIELLRQIAEKVQIPIVMHGASGLSDSDIRMAILAGVAKFNIDTNIKHVYTREIESSKEDDYRVANAGGITEVEKVVKRYIKLIGK